MNWGALKTARKIGALGWKRKEHYKSLWHFSIEWKNYVHTEVLWYNTVHNSTVCDIRVIIDFVIWLWHIWTNMHYIFVHWFTWLLCWYGLTYAVSPCRGARFSPTKNGVLVIKENSIWWCGFCFGALRNVESFFCCYYFQIHYDLELEWTC